MKRSFSTLVFDADGVLVQPKSWFVDPANAQYGVPKALFMAFIHGDFKRCTTGELELLELLPDLLARWGVRVSAQQFLAHWLEHENAVDSAMLTELASWRQAGLRCVVATNQERHRANFMRQTMGLGRACDGFFASCELGARKPERGFYDAVTQRLGVAPHDLLFWDDSLENITGAQLAGWQAEQFLGLNDFKRRMGVIFDGS